MKSRKFLKLAVPLAILSLSACATPFRADVARFQQMPAPQGQSFVIQAADPRNEGGIEFSQYAALVSQRLAQQGYQPANNSKTATLVVTVDYGVDSGKERIVSRPGYGPGWGHPYWGRWGYRPFYYGWHDPWWGYPEIDSYTYYTSHLDLVIDRASDGQRLFEGKARARSTTDSLPTLVPNLVEAMFTNFPGRSGEEVRITIPPPAKG